MGFLFPFRHFDYFILIYTAGSFELGSSICTAALQVRDQMALGYPICPPDPQIGDLSTPPRIPVRERLVRRELRSSIQR